MQELYDMIFKRKSFRRFDETFLLSEDELQRIKEQLLKTIPLMDDINVEFRIVKREKTSCKRGEYCLLMYSEQKPYYLLNVRYILEQLDLWMTSQNIGTCWYGMGKPDEPQYEGLDYVIMLAFGKGRPEEFRKDYTKAKRKDLDMIWSGEHILDVTNVVRYAPSACNSQPWRVACENDYIRIFHSTEVRSIIPKAKLPYYNSIDIGIFLCFMEIALRQNHYKFKRMLCEEQKSDAECIEIAQYIISKIY